MTNWQTYVDVSDVFHDDDLTIQAKAHAISARMRKIPSYTLWELLDELLDTADVEEFDEVWSYIYDWADENRVWIETRSKLRPEALPREAVYVGFE